MPSYHFDVGDSGAGPIGLCARVRAATKTEALALLREALPEQVSVASGDGAEGVEYINVYINDTAITESDADDDMVEP